MWLAKFAQLIRRGAGFKPRQAGSHFCVLNATLHWVSELPRHKRLKRQAGCQAKGRATAKTPRRKRIIIFWETNWLVCIFRKKKQNKTWAIMQRLDWSKASPKQVTLFTYLRKSFRTCVPWKTALHKPETVVLIPLWVTCPQDHRGDGFELKIFKYTCFGHTNDPRGNLTWFRINPFPESSHNLRCFKIWKEHLSSPYVTMNKK